MKNELKKWVTKTTIWMISLTIAGYAAIWLTYYLITDIKEAGPFHPAEMSFVALGGIAAAIPMIGAVTDIAILRPMSDIPLPTS